MMWAVLGPHGARYVALVYTALFAVWIVTGRILNWMLKGESPELILEIPPHLTELQLGDSINVNGVCLTLVEKKEQKIELDLSQETLQKTILGALKEGDLVNLERALRLVDRLGGHIVTGHIDGTGIIVGKNKERDFLQLRIKIPLLIASL
jgi:riboflavin synthase